MLFAWASQCFLSENFGNRLIAVEEPQDPLWSMRQMMESMEPTVNFVAEMTGNQHARLQKKVEIKMLFKFELK
jgi:hypothetical protein